MASILPTESHQTEKYFLRACSRMNPANGFAAEIFPLGGDTVLGA